MHRFTVLPRGPFCLAESARFSCSFVPGAGGARVRSPEELVMAFASDGDFAPVVARVTSRPGDDGVDVEATRAAPGLEAQVARILSLDVDATSFADVVAHDAEVAFALAERPGFRPVVFPSPYDAAVWGVLAQRVPMAFAATLKARLCEATGTVARGFGESFVVAPHPAHVLAVGAVAGVPAEKLRRLHAIAEAALDGRLDAKRLRGLPAEVALAELETLPGVGPWTAALVLYRGAGVADALPLEEPRLLAALGALSGARGLDQVRSRAAAWAPFRMWVSVLLVSRLAGTPAWNGPGAPAGNEAFARQAVRRDLSVGAGARGARDQAQGDRRSPGGRAGGVGVRGAAALLKPTKSGVLPPDRRTSHLVQPRRSCPSEHPCASFADALAGRQFRR